MKGLIFDIKELALFDGPGIRTTVFLKGCPLSCSWCHNPEGINHEVEVMRVKVVCPECGESTFSDSVCTHCTASLPKNMISPPRITGQWIESEKLAQQLLKDRAILEKNGGGVTFSGGEPLFQASFLLEVITHLEGLHTAIETSGFASEALFTKVIEAVNLIYMDIKIIDNELHKKFCGQSNEPILKNLQLLKRSGKPFIIRIPIIPTLNDNDENFIKTATLLADSPSLIKVELLPYQHTAGAKYSMLSRPYQPGFDTNASPYLNPTLFRERGIPCTIL